MPWFPEIANPAFCETLHLRRIILDRQMNSAVGSTRQRVLEPGSAEFISALAAGSNSRYILHVGCGLSTIALAAAAKATGGRLYCVDNDPEKQATVGRYIKELQLSSFVDFFLEDPSMFIPQRDGFDFVLFTGEPELYVEHFDLVSFRQAAIVVAYNALDDATNDYIKHVRRQPGIDSSTLPVGRGIEVSKILSWDDFKSGRMQYRPRAEDVTFVNTAYLRAEDATTACSRAAEDATFVNPNFLAEHSRHHHPDDDDLQREVPELPAMDPVENHRWEQEDYSSFDESLYESPWSCSGREVSQFLCISSSSESDYQGSKQTLETALDSPAVSVGTSAGEEIDGLVLHFKSMEVCTELKIEGRDQHMLLTDITMALNEANVSVQEARISTANEHVEDIFYVVDGQTKKRLDEAQQQVVRENILKRIRDKKC